MSVIESAGSSGGSRAGGGPLAGLQVLLAEDNEISQLLATELLEDAGACVVLAENGQEALASLETQAFDVVLMDCLMPLMDGYAAARAIRADPRWSVLPLIAMTAKELRRDREDVLAAGMNDCVTKPIDAELLYATIRRWLPPAKA